MLIVGAGGHAIEVLDVLIKELDKHLIVFFDDTSKLPRKVHDYFNVISDELGVKNFFKNDNKFCLGVGSPIVRQKLTERMLKLGGQYTNIVASSAILSKYSTINGDIMHHVFVGSKVHVGRGTLLNTGVQIHHNAKVGEYVELSPNAILLGKASIGDFCRIGSNAKILPGVVIGKKSVIGAGAVVTKNIPANSLAVGIPAKVIKSL